MGVQFNADEVFEMAQQVERNGAAFYTRAAEVVKNEKAKGLFAELARWEHRHEELFGAMRAELTEKEKGGDVFDPDEQVEAYLHAVVEGRIFDVHASPAKQLTGRESAADVLKIAIDREKDSVVFYAGIRAATATELGKSRIDAIIREEMRHITILVEQLHKQ
jgi:rubrerythrin